MSPLQKREQKNLKNVHIVQNKRIKVQYGRSNDNNSTESINTNIKNLLFNCSFALILLVSIFWHQHHFFFFVRQHWWQRRAGLSVFSRNSAPAYKEWPSNNILRI